MPDSRKSITVAATRVAFVLVPRFNMMSLAALLEPMRIANYLSHQPLYHWEYLSAEGGEVPASNGMRQATKTLAGSGAGAMTGAMTGAVTGAVTGARTGAGASDPEQVFVCGSWGAEHYHNTELFNWLRRLHRKGARLAAIELGIYVLARAGLLGDRVATTHWAWMPGFAEQFPRVQTREQLYTEDGGILTCAGGTATLDLGLHLIAERHGGQFAYEVAEQILHHPLRSASAPQRHTLGAATDKIPADLRAAVKLIEDHIEEPLSVPEIAARAGISQRQLERLFKRNIGCSAVQFSQLLRLQYARVLLASTRLSIRDVSAATGFNSMSYFSQAFARCFGKKPSECRHAWPDREAAPSWPGTALSFIEKARLAAGQLR
jgi:AraC family carnitine catabolism transcriptional activator